MHVCAASSTIVECLFEDVDTDCSYFPNQSRVMMRVSFCGKVCEGMYDRACVQN